MTQQLYVSYAINFGAISVYQSMIAYLTLYKGKKKKSKKIFSNLR